MEIDIKYKQNTETYKETMKIDIENITIVEKRNKVYTTQWRTILEVIEQGFLKRTEIFQMILLNNVGIIKMKVIFYQLR